MQCMLEDQLGQDNAGRAYYFGGHRPVRDRYGVRADGRYIQIHDPDRFVVAWLQPEREIEPDRDVCELTAETLGNGS